MNHNSTNKRSMMFIVGFITCLHFITPVNGQVGLRQSLERLDLNENDLIEPSEVTSLSRPFLERISRARRISLEEPQSIERLLSAARIHYALSNGLWERDVRPQGEPSVKPFGPDRDEPLVPQFGLAEIRFPYTQDDLDFADRTMRSHDHNRDGFIDRDEAANNRWTHRDPFADDLNKDERLSRMELTQRYARRRLLDEAADELRQRDRRLRSGRQDEQDWDRREDRRSGQDSRWARREGRDAWLSANMMSRFDENQNGRLDFEEAESLGMPFTQIDADLDGEIDMEELYAHVLSLQNSVGSYTEGLPGWFYEKDLDRDGQIQLKEFTAEWSDESVAEFLQYDLNEDGLLTPAELMQSTADVGGKYFNDNSEILAPQRTIISEIEIADDFLIRDIDVQVSLTHSYIGQLDGYLTGPDGTRIELFTEIGGGADFFEDTIFDDQAQELIQRARPPYDGRYKPEGVGNRQPGLSQFNDKSVQGVWQLVIRGTRSERFGMLHNWGLIIQPRED